MTMTKAARQRLALGAMAVVAVMTLASAGAWYVGRVADASDSVDLAEDEHLVIQVKGKGHAGKDAYGIYYSIPAGFEATITAPKGTQAAFETTELDTYDCSGELCFPVLAFYQVSHRPIAGVERDWVLTSYTEPWSNTDLCKDEPALDCPGQPLGIQFEAPYEYDAGSGDVTSHGEWKVLVTSIELIRGEHWTSGHYNWLVFDKEEFILEAKGGDGDWAWI